MGAIDDTLPAARKALTLAALALPGLSAAVALEGADGIDIQYSRYREGRRDIFSNDFLLGVTKVPQNLRPIEVDGLDLTARTTLREHARFIAHFTQDTWSGATPLGASPLVSQAGNSPRRDADGIISGASPLAALPMYGEIAIDRQGNFLDAKGKIDNRHTDVLSSASPETRQQGDFALLYALDNATLSLGGGLSSERDYESRFVSLGGSVLFNARRTTLAWSLGYTNSETRARLDPDALPYIATDYYDAGLCTFDGGFFVEHPKVPSGYVSPTCGPDGFGGFGRVGATLHGTRHDKSGQLSLTQVVGKHDVLSVGLGYTHSTGYLANPYKVVFGHVANFTNDDPVGKTNLFGDTGSSALLEVRPKLRMLFDWHLGLVHYVPRFDAGLHLDYRFAHDDWGVRAHTVEGQWVQPLPHGWMATPRLRYYTQSRADFYTLAVFDITQLNTDPAGNVVSAEQLSTWPRHYSSDHRLSGFGTLGPGITISKTIADGLRLEAGFDYTLRGGDLKWGGGGEDDFADFDYWTANAALSVDFDALGAGTRATGPHAHHADHALALPAGVMFGHALTQRGDWMVGYRFVRRSQGGDVLHGGSDVALAEVRSAGCEGRPCAVTPRSMGMNMHMVEIMYALSDRMTLMFMPQWQDMNMTMTPNPDITLVGPHGAHSGAHRHETGGVGDTGVYALYRLVESRGQELTASLGVTAPTGDVEQRLRKDVTTPVFDQLLHYDMQLGSGTWDLVPSATYRGTAGQWLWGAQAVGTVRLERRNSSKYVLGDQFQGSLWGGYRVLPWLAASMRGIYTAQGRIAGRLASSTQIDPFTGQPFVPEHIGPFDFRDNSGGEYADVAVGLNASVPLGPWRYTQLGVEVQLPAWEDVLGYQQARNPAVNVTLGMPF